MLKSPIHKHNSQQLLPPHLSGADFNREKMLISNNILVLTINIAHCHAFSDFVQKMKIQISKYVCSSNRQGYASVFLTRPPVSGLML